MTSSYFHIMFTSLDLDALKYSPAANVTAFKVFDPNTTVIMNALDIFNNMSRMANKTALKYFPVSHVNKCSN